MSLTEQSNHQQAQWIDICEINEIPPMSGVCALHQGKQVAIFNLTSDPKKSQVRSICNIDPIANASVLSRGIIAEIDGKQVVSSPLYKQHFCLQTGECLQDESINVRVYPTRLKNNRVQLKLSAAS